MKAILVLLVVAVTFFGCSEHSERNIPTYEIGEIEEPIKLKYEIPEDIPLALAETYAHFQEDLTEKQFQFFLMQVKRFCDGYMDDNLLHVRIRLWFPDIQEGHGYWLPRFNRSRQGRSQAQFAYELHRDIPYSWQVANDRILSRANKDIWYGPKKLYDVYDCVEDYK